MRVVAIEEHVWRFDMMSRIPAELASAQGWPAPGELPAGYGDAARTLAEPVADRIAAMDRDGVAVQVVSVVGPGAELLPPDEAPAFAAAYNDKVAGMISEAPDRLAAFAHLPMSAPEAAADELERAVGELGFRGGMVNGTTRGRFLDDPAFDVLLGRAARLGCPLYIHPAPPPASVREAYYGDLPGVTGRLLAMGGWGWHAETAVHVIRLALSGALDRHRGLKIVIGHMGEGLPAGLARLDDIMSPIVTEHLERRIGEAILDQVWITTSGFYTLPPFLAALTTFGADRILFSADYPYSPGGRQVEFLQALPVSPADREKIAHRNADTLLGLS